jgi:hypothetical protein
MSTFKRKERVAESVLRERRNKGHQLRSNGDLPPGELFLDGRVLSDDNDADFSTAMENPTSLPSFAKETFVFTNGIESDRTGTEISL